MTGWSLSSPNVSGEAPSRCKNVRDSCPPVRISCLLLESSPSLRPLLPPLVILFLPRMPFSLLILGLLALLSFRFILHRYCRWVLSFLCCSYAVLNPLMHQLHDLLLHLVPRLLLKSDYGIGNEGRALVISVSSLSTSPLQNCVCLSSKTRSQDGCFKTQEWWMLVDGCSFLYIGVDFFFFPGSCA